MIAVESGLRDAANLIPDVNRERLCGRGGNAAKHAKDLVSAARRAHRAAVEVARLITPERVS